MWEADAALDEAIFDQPTAPVIGADRFKKYNLKQSLGFPLEKALSMTRVIYRGVIERTEQGGYPLLEHLRLILEGPVVWAPAVDGAVVLSQRGGDFELTVGQDFSIGYLSHDAVSVQLYLEESFTFQVIEPRAAVHLAYAD